MKQETNKKKRKNQYATFFSVMCSLVLLTGAYLDGAFSNRTASAYCICVSILAEYTMWSMIMFNPFKKKN